MAMGEIGMFLPPESAYGTPGMYSQALRAEATKRASYLSQMDQFYAQLEESKRQFEETMSFQQSQWEDQLSLSRDELALQRKLGLANTLLGLLQARNQAQATKARSYRPGHIELGGRDEKLDLLRDVYESSKEPASETGSSWLGPGFSYPSASRVWNQP